MNVIKKKWWNWSGHEASVCRCISPGLDTPFVRYFKEVDYEMAVKKLVVAMGKLGYPGIRQDLK